MVLSYGGSTLLCFLPLGVCTVVVSASLRLRQHYNHSALSYFTVLARICAFGGRTREAKSHTADSGSDIALTCAPVLKKHYKEPYNASVV